MTRKIITNIVFVITFLSSASSFAYNSASSNLKKVAEKTTSSKTQKIIDEFSAYAGTIKPEVREEIQKYRVEVVNINKKKRELYNSLSKEAQNFLAEQQKYKQKLLLSKSTSENNQENNQENNISNESKNTDKK